MAANFLNTNRNANRFFFATTDSGEQELSLNFSTTGGVINLSTMSVVLSPDGGSVIVNQAPQFVASECVIGEQAIATGTDSTYFTLSSFASTVVGVNISYDRFPGSGQASIETYNGGGNFGGVEFLNRNVTSDLISTGVAGVYLSTIGRPGASVVLDAQGSIHANTTWTTGVECYNVETSGAGQGRFSILDLSGIPLQPLARWSIGTTGIPSGLNSGSDLAFYQYADNGNFIATAATIKRSDGSFAINNMSSINNFPYQNLISTGINLGVPTSNFPTQTLSTIWEYADANTSNLIPGRIYQVSLPMFAACSNTTTSTNTHFDVGIGIGGGTPVLQSAMLIPPGGQDGQVYACSFNTMLQMGSNNFGIQVYGKITNNNTPQFVSATTNGSVTAYFKNII